MKKSHSQKRNSMKPVVLIQCRSSSSRLPGKALLPIRGIVSSVLCAKRAANNGLDVKIVTSKDPSDDELVKTLKAEKVAYFRGDLRNVLRRFHDALNEVDGCTAVVRLTADNLFVDGTLIEEALLAFQEQGKGYLTLHPPSLTGTPYGLSVEVFSVEALRSAHSEVLDHHDCEHVTPWIIRRYGLNTYRPRDLKSGQAHLRCTMDSWADYQRMLDVFGRVSDPTKATWQELCDHLHIIGPTHGIPQRFSSKGNIAELALGTVQLGLPYGIANTDGQPTFENAKELVQRAIVHGVTHLDCAAAYGVAEARLGQIVNRDYQSQVTIVTKLSPLTQLSETSKDPDIEAHVTASVYKSCIDLNIKQLPYLLLHRWQHRTSNGGRIWEVLKQLQQKGVIKRLGASVQNPEEALQAIDDPEIKFIQLPFNLLDRRFQQSGFSKKAEARKDVVIQARSVFLQGVLISPAQTWPDITNIKAVDIIDQLSALAKKFNRGSISDLCVAYVRSQSWIDCLVVGMENMNQLDQNVALFQNPRLNGSECMEVEEVFSNLPEELLNPALWIRKEETK